MTLVLETVRGDKEINRGQFYQALVDAMTSRMLPQSERSITDCVSTLFPSPWPEDCSLVYGESELKLACEKFRIPYTGELKQQYRDFKDSRGSGVPGLHLKRLIGVIHTLPVSTAECERGFSRMNLICTPLRSMLTVKHLSSLMFMSLVGPPIEQWHPLPYVRRWLAAGRHAATDAGNAQKKAHANESDAQLAVWKCFDM